MLNQITDTSRVFQMKCYQLLAQPKLESDKCPVLQRGPSCHGGTAARARGKEEEEEEWVKD